MENKDIQTLRNWIKNSTHIVFLTGAGISKASGIPDIRGKEGLSKREENDKKYGASYEEIVSHEYFMNNTEKFFKYYFDQMIYKNALPNRAHKAIARLDSKSCVITQNIDGLHTLAGSKNVIELHGSVCRNKCLNCGANYTLDEMLKFNGIPKCKKCGGYIKPEVVLFGESLNEDDLTEAVQEIGKADLLIVIGSSLVVNPAASLPFYFYGSHMVIINKDETPLDSRANMVIREDVESFIDLVIDF